VNLKEDIMRVLAISQEDHSDHLDLIKDMHRLRRRVFKDRLDWEVSVAGDMEVDPYDALGPTYLIGITPADQVVACVRLLPTTGAYMLANTFPALLGGIAPPRDLALFESSRFCIDTEGAAEIGEKGLRLATFVLFAAVLEWGLARELRGIATVTDLRMERILKRAGWILERYAAPLAIGNTQAVAGRLPVTASALDGMRRAGNLDGPALMPPRTHTLAA